MVIVRSFFAVFAIITLLGAGTCQRKVTSLVITTGSYGSTPVIINSLFVNDTPYRFEQTVVVGMSDTMTPRGTGAWLIPVPDGISDPVLIKTEWTELLTGRAYSAVIGAPLDKFDIRRLGSGRYQTTITPIYGPNGLLVIASDPIPTSVEDIPKNDVARICGVRVPSADKDWRTEVDNVAQLKEAYTFTYPPVENPECIATER